MDVEGLAGWDDLEFLQGVIPGSDGAWLPEWDDLGGVQRWLSSLHSAAISTRPCLD